MLSTYRAVLKGNYLEWADDAPVQGNHPVPVQITVLAHTAEQPSAKDALTRLNDLRSSIQQKYGVYSGDIVAEVRMTRETQLEQVLKNQA